MSDKSSPQNSRSGFTHLTPVSHEQIVAFSFEKHTIDDLYDQLKKSHPDLARFIMSRSEQISPRDIKSKQALAQLALEAIYILDAQGEVMSLDELFATPSIDQPLPPPTIPPAA
ncbi:MAG: hypothetical protein QG629_155 [Patescibacteria group bacterium]|nr:hypothetical protein [Candidatus Saccharibacteria bacterium]MDQ5963073.1 hypothetical protein [Patescibacteria group bacterium]